MLKRALSTLFALATLLAGAAAQDVTSSNLQLLLMGNGLHPSDWGTNTNANLQKVESAVTGVSSVSVGGGTLTLTNDQARYAAFKLSGTLSSDLTIVFPSTPRVFVLSNATLGSFGVTVKCGAGTTLAVRQGQADKLVCDGTNVFSATPANTDIIPVGTMFNYAGSAAPNGYYALCDGTEVSRSTYASLYSAIGTTYGAGNGVTTFNLPDTRGRVIASLDGGTGRLNGWARGQTGGASTVTLTTNELPAHNHTLTDPGHTHGVTDPGHQHGLNFVNAYAAGANGATSGGGGAGNTASNTTGITINSHTTGITLASAGSGNPFSNLPPTLVANCIIRIQ